MNSKDIKDTIDRYNRRVDEHGFTDLALGWTKENNSYRFKAMANEWIGELSYSSILDFGCGYADYCTYLKSAGVLNFQYTGLDINETLLKEAKRRHPQAKFVVGNLMELSFDNNFDFIFSSGVFNHKLSDANEYSFIFNSLEKLFSICNRGLAVNFLSDKVEYFTEHNFNSNPGKILEFAYGLSNHVVLRNDYMPFEFTIYIRKDKGVDKSRLVYL